MLLKDLVILGPKWLSLLFTSTYKFQSLLLGQAPSAAEDVNYAYNFDYWGSSKGEGTLVIRYKNLTDNTAWVNIVTAGYIFTGYGWHYEGQGTFSLQADKDYVIKVRVGEMGGYGQLSALRDWAGMAGTTTLAFHEIVDFQLFAKFAAQWLKTNCAAPDWCDGADLNTNTVVNFVDLKIFCDYWLQLRPD